MKLQINKPYKGDLLVLNGLIIIDESGLTLYCNTIGLKGFNLDPFLIGGFLTAVQTFAKEFDPNKKSYIREMSMQDNKFLYRKIENYNFVGIVDKKSSLKTSETILEYMIWCFLSLNRKYLKDKNELVDLAELGNFDDCFLQHRSSKEKDLHKWLQSINSSYLQELLNQFTNYFPISEIIKIDPKNLQVIGKKIIWVNLRIRLEDEEKIVNKLKDRATLIYGADLFKNIDREVRLKLTK